MARGSELARQALAALAISPDIAQKIVESGGEAALRSPYGRLDG
jgi:hypothetical protein